MTSVPTAQAPHVARPNLVPGQRAVVRITDIAFGGEGVGRLQDFVVFVPFVVVGEEVELEIVEVKKQFARARLLSVLQSSAQRVTPVCPYFGECGGCQYQHIAYATQLELKRKQVADLFERIGGFAAALVAPVIPCPQPYGYRNRLMIRSQWNKPEQKLNIGFLRADSRLVVDLEACAIAEPALNEQIRHVRAHPPPRGGLKVVVRIAPEGWEVPRDSFFQNNFFLLAQLAETVRERLRAGGARFLVDAYCGVGFFGIEAARVVEAFVGVEIDRQAVQAARRNAAARGVVNGNFIEGRAEQLLGGILHRFEAATTAILLDPPRTGCPEPALAALRQHRPGQILYVSCHPATLARDLNVLCADGVFELVNVNPLDMFPQTQHVECIADLRRRS
ncbi:MAG TPA: TRAM domain-containing protein [Verrucomicrobiae bacterium]|nr:TRAM domain-containing protein [Verrucomicrobiae bacterium]